MSLERKLTLFRKLTASVANIHKAGIAHRDIKPENALLEDDTDDVKVIDFGLSRKTDYQSPHGEVMGTPNYLCLGHLRDEADRRKH